MPSILDQMPTGGMAAILTDPTTRALHVDAITAFADDMDADGIDIDYEQFAFADGSDTWAVTQPAWVAFVKELAGALHADDRTLTVSIPAIYDPAATVGDRGYWVYDHGTIAEYVDALRIMAYDYSTAEPGPIAPLAWVQQAVDGVNLAVAPEHPRPARAGGSGLRQQLGGVHQRHLPGGGRGAHHRHHADGGRPRGPPRRHAGVRSP